MKNRTWTMLFAALLCLGLMAGCAGRESAEDHTTVPAVTAPQQSTTEQVETSAQETQAILMRVTGTVSAKSTFNENGVDLLLQELAVYGENGALLTQVPVQAQSAQNADGSAYTVYTYEVLLQPGSYILKAQTQDCGAQEQLLSLAREAAQLDFVFLSDNGLVTSAHEKELVYTSTRYNLETKRAEEVEITLTYRIPKINLPGAAVGRINQELYDALYPEIEFARQELDENEALYIASRGITYQWTVRGDILSLMVKNEKLPDYGGQTGYTVYNLRISTGEEVSAKALLEEVGLTEKEYYDAARLALGSLMVNDQDPTKEYFRSENFLDYFFVVLEKTTSKRNLGEALPYLNEQGQLCIAAKVYSMAGAEYYWRALKVEDYETSPYYSKEEGFHFARIIDVGAGGWCSLALREDGTVWATGRNEHGQCDVAPWTDIVAISGGDCHTVGLKSDGSVVVAGINNFGQSDITHWENIVKISAGTFHTAAVRADGTAVAAGRNDEGQCNLEGWTDIVRICAGEYHTVGLRADGTVVAVGRNNYGQCQVSQWTDIVAIGAGVEHTVALRADGTVLAIGLNQQGQCKVSSWDNVAEIVAGDYHTVARKNDGTVVATGMNDYGQCKVSSWKNVVKIAARFGHTVALTADGKVLATGWTKYGICDVKEW